MGNTQLSKKTQGDSESPLKNMKEMRKQTEAKVEHISKYGNIFVTSKSLHLFKDHVIPEVKKRKILLKEISASQLPHGENLEFIFNNELDFSELKSVSIMYLNGRNIRIDDVLKTSQLTLMGIGLKTDDLIKQFRDVEHLDIRGNFFDTFPSSVMNFKKALTRLNLMGLMIEKLPDDFGELTSLRLLNLSENRFTEIRDDHISKMTNLDSFKCFDNLISKFLVKSFPPKLSIINASKNKIKKIPSKFPETLKEIYFHHNEISTPVDVTGLKELQKLGVSNNKLTEVKMKGCTKLYQLDLSHNCLSDESIIGLEECVKLEEVHLSLNNLTEKIFSVFPKGEDDDDDEEEEEENPKIRPNRIRKLCIGYNKISTIPTELFTELCIRLTWIDLSGNYGLKEIPNSITTLLKDNSYSRLTLILGDLPNLNSFPEERIDKKMGYFVAWGTPLFEDFKELYSKEISPDCFSSDFTDLSEQQQHIKKDEDEDEGEEEEEEEQKVVSDDTKIPRTSHCSIKGPYRPQNEDAYIDTKLCDGKYHLIAVLDGHGGVVASQFAAKNVPVQLSDLLVERMKKDDGSIPAEELIKLFRDSILKTNQMLKTEKVKDGTTFVSILYDVEQDFFVVANLGDSRGIISYRMKKKESSIELTRDHKPTDPIELKWMEESGVHVLVNSKVDNIIGVTRSMGDFKYDLNTEPEFGVVENVSIEVEFVMLCCDGVFDVFESEEVLEIVREEMIKKSDLQYVANKVVNLAVSNNSRDNISAIIVDFCGGKYDEEEEEGEEEEEEEEEEEKKE